MPSTTTNDLWNIFWKSLGCSKMFKRESRLRNNQQLQWSTILCQSHGLWYMGPNRPLYSSQVRTRQSTIVPLLLDHTLLGCSTRRLLRPAPRWEPPRCRRHLPLRRASGRVKGRVKVPSGAADDGIGDDSPKRIQANQGRLVGWVDWTKKLCFYPSETLVTYN